MLIKIRHYVFTHLLLPLCVAGCFAPFQAMAQYDAQYGAQYDGIEKLVKGAPAQVGNLPVVAPRVEDANLTVTDVVIDKTAANAVLAREAAMAAARQEAFRKLAAQHLSPAAMAAFTPPTDSTIASLVQDLEITGERLSATRYVGTFTVRFRDAVRRYIPVPVARPVLNAAANGDTQPDSDFEGAGGSADMASLPVADTKPHRRLILPYFENIAGATLLWEDPNPWRDTWQANPPRPPRQGGQYLVPLGDIGDVSAGSSEAVWSGDYRVLDTLLRNYGATEIVLAVANRSGPYMTIDVYSYARGQFRRRDTLAPYVGERTDAQAFQFGQAEVIRFLETPENRATADTVAGISRSLTTTDIAVAVPGGSLSPAPSTAQLQMNGSMRFNSLAAWIEAQRRFSSMHPPVHLDILSISSEGAQFVMRYDGTFDSLRAALAMRGIMLGLPTVDVGGGSSGRTVYDLRLVN